MVFCGMKILVIYSKSKVKSINKACRNWLATMFTIILIILGWNCLDFYSGSQADDKGKVKRGVGLCVSDAKASKFCTFYPVYLTGDF